jgi:hypothetical protein
MTLRTIAVTLENGTIRPLKGDDLPARGEGYLTLITEKKTGEQAGEQRDTRAGLARFLASPAFEVTPETLTATLRADFYEQ